MDFLFIGKNFKTVQISLKIQILPDRLISMDVTLLKYGGRGREGEEARFFLNLFSVYFQDI